MKRLLGNRYFCTITQTLSSLFVVVLVARFFWINSQQTVDGFLALPYSIPQAYSDFQNSFDQTTTFGSIVSGFLLVIGVFIFLIGFALWWAILVMLYLAHIILSLSFSLFFDSDIAQKTSITIMGTSIVYIFWKIVSTVVYIITCVIFGIELDEQSRSKKWKVEV